MPNIYSITYQPEYTSPRPSDRFNRLSISHTTLIADHGIQGDRKAGRNLERQINIMSYETLQLMAAQGFKTDPGAMGEQMIIQGLDVAALHIGDRLHLSKTALIEVVSHRTSCKRLDRVQNITSDIQYDDLGIFVRVIIGGHIAVGDEVSLIPHQETIAHPHVDCAPC